MASIRREISLTAPAERVWDAIRDFGAVHERVAPGFVVACALDGDARVLTFGNGSVVREVLVDLDDEARRLAYAIQNERVRHYNASLQVFRDGESGSRVVWIIDVLPNELEEYVARQADVGLRAMQTTLERA